MFVLTAAQVFKKEIKESQFLFDKFFGKKIYCTLSDYTNKCLIIDVSGDKKIFWFSGSVDRFPLKGHLKFSVFKQNKLKYNNQYIWKDFLKQNGQKEMKHTVMTNEFIIRTILNL